MQDGFRRISAAITSVVGSPAALVVAIGVIVAWAVTGPLFGFSDTWQLIINTGTTIVTFLMVFVIQSSQNRNAKAVHLKLDELIASIQQADNTFMTAETESEEEQDRQIEALRRLATANSERANDLEARQDDRSSARSDDHSPQAGQGSTENASA